MPRWSKFALGVGALAMAAVVGAQRLAPAPLVNPSSVMPATLLPAPPARGSAQESAELAELHALIASASPDRMAQATADAAVEDPSIFDPTAGRDLKALPATWALLVMVQTEADRTVDVAKEHFARMRPWGVDTTLHNCETTPGRKPTRSYPSGHAVLAYSVGYVLAQLRPVDGERYLARAADYALSRQYCASHFPSDTEASHVIGTLVAARLLADPRLASRIAAARAELAN